MATDIVRTDDLRAILLKAIYTGRREWLDPSDAEAIANDVLVALKGGEREGYLNYEVTLEWPHEYLSDRTWTTATGEQAYQSARDTAANFPSRTRARVSLVLDEFEQGGVGDGY